MRPTRSLIGPLVGVLTGLGLIPTVDAKEISADQAPAAWVAYATDAVRTITGWLNGETPPAPRVRALLNMTRSSPDQATPPLVVKLWVDGQGTITRTEFAPLGEAQADQDLQALLQGQRLAPPPRGMRLPMRIALQLPPPPAPGSVADAPPPAGVTVH